jgi:hypothetical protein
MRPALRVKGLANSKGDELRAVDGRKPRACPSLNITIIMFPPAGRLRSSIRAASSDSGALRTARTVSPATMTMHHSRLSPAAYSDLLQTPFRRHSIMIPKSSDQDSGASHPCLTPERSFEESMPSSVKRLLLRLATKERKTLKLDRARARPRPSCVLRST